MKTAVSWIDEHLDPSNTVAIFTDSQSLCSALQGTSAVLDGLRQSISRVKCHLTVQWIPGHCDIPGNELADSAAKAASSAQGPLPGITFSNACCHVKQKTKDPPIAHDRTRKVYQSLSRQRERLVDSRADQSLLAKLRSGHHTAFRAYKNRIDGTTDPLCPLCAQEPHTLEHWLQNCPATAAKRWFLFGEDTGELDCLTKHPLESLSLARSTLLGE